MVNLEMQESPVPKVGQALEELVMPLPLQVAELAHLEPKDHQEQPDPLGQLVQKEDQEMLEPQAKMVTLELLELRALQDNRVQQVKMVLKDQMVETVKLVPKVKLAEKDPLEDQDLKDPQETLARMASQALKVQQDPKAQLEMQDKAPPWVVQVVQVELVHLVKMLNTVHVQEDRNWLRKPKLKFHLNVSFKVFKNTVNITPSFLSSIFY